VLVHGRAGAVGIFAVQLAHLHGAHVISTVSAKNGPLVTQLGADEVIDYKSVRFEDRVRDVDVVFDTVGANTLERSWSLLKSSGRMITIAADGESSTDPRVKDIFFIVEPKQEQLIEIARLLDSGELKTFVDAAVPMEESAKAYAKTIPQVRGYGKVVITIPASKA
jgi:NADPH:quinone reductase-like Zn-dependent oxidoreductase